MLAIDSAPARARVSLASLVPGDQVDGDFLLVESELKTARNGQPYWRARLADDRGNTLGANRFDFLDEPPPAGTLVHVVGLVEKYGSGRVMRIVSCACLGDEAAESWLPRVRVDGELLAQRLHDALDCITSPHMRALLDEILSDPDTCRRYLTVPAASRYHSARLGGLALHSLAVRRLALDIAAALDGFRCDTDLLATAALLHDLGKIDELDLSLATGGEPTYTVAQLQGHIVQGVRRIERAALSVGLPSPLLEHLIHIVVSHHGKEQWGSPVVPMTPEAVVLHVADYAASRVEAVLDMSDAREGDDPWTPRSGMLDTKVYLGFSSPLEVVA